MKAAKMYLLANRVPTSFSVTLLFCVWGASGCVGGARHAEPVQSSSAVRGADIRKQETAEPATLHEASKAASKRDESSRAVESPTKPAVEVEPKVTCSEHPPELVGSSTPVSLELTIQKEGHITRSDGSIFKIGKELPEPAGPPRPPVQFDVR